MATVTLTPSGAQLGGEPDEDAPERESLVPPADRRFGRYRLCFELASGGMGKVYLARMEGPGGFEKFAAVKRIHAHLAERQGFVEMFLDEARLTSRIDHPNVCSILDFGEAAGRYYIAMEYLFGEPLSRVLGASLRAGDDPRRARFVARILAHACEGLHAAHELRGPDGEPLEVVHRDVSPHNIFVTYDGGVRVVDFGIARAADQIHETTTGSVRGKWAYMAPEQARGGVVDRRADIWSLGVILWEAAAGRRLFRRATQTETILAVVGADVPPPSSVDPRVPPEIDEIATRALSRDPEARWASARAMGQALSHALARSGQPLGQVELGEWMDEVFPGAAERKRGLLASARESSDPFGDAADEGAAVAPSLAVPSLAVPSVAAPAAPPSVTEPAVASPQARSAGASRRGVWAAAGLAALAGFGVAAWALSAPLTRWLGDDAPVPLAAAPSPASEVAASEVAAPEVAASEVAAPEVAAPAAPPVAEVPGVVDAPVAEGAAEEETPVEAAAPAEPERPRRARRRARPAAAAPAPRGVGHVTVVTTGGWGLVYEGSRMLGETPSRLELSAGRHVLEIRPFGRAPGVRRVVDVEPDGRHRLSVPVAP